MSGDLGITYVSLPPLPVIATYIGACQCREWPMAALFGRGRCKRCGTGTTYVGRDPEMSTGGRPRTA